VTGRTRGRWVVLLLLLAGAAGLSTLPTWARATATAPVTGDIPVTVSGAQAAPGVVAAALVLLAAAGAVGLVGRFGRWVVVVVVAGAGALITSSALAARSGARATAERLAGDRTGVAQLVAEPEVAAWPWVAAALGVLVLVAAVALARASARWAPPSSRHERAGVVGTAPGAAGVAGAAVAGSVPTDPGPAGPSGTGLARDGSSSAGSSSAGSSAAGSAAADPGPVGPTPDRSTPPAAGTDPIPADSDAAPAPAAPAPADERATWDALSRGDDPT
jgi:hypothetical protein